MQPARRRGDFEPRFGRAGNGAGPAEGSAMNEQSRGAGRPCGKQQPPRGGQVVMTGEAPHFADHRRRRAAFERFLHRPEQRLRIGRAHEDKVAKSQPMRDEARPIKSARLPRAKIFAYEQGGRRMG
jgi:hypothetical protein